MIAAEKERTDKLKNQDVTPIETVSIDQEQTSKSTGLSVALQSANIYNGSSEVLKPDNGRLIVISVELTNHTSANIKASNVDFELKATDSEEESAISTLLSTTHYTNMPVSVTIKPGESITKNLAFDVPASSTYELTYQELYNHAKLQWDFQFQTDQPKS